MKIIVISEEIIKPSRKTPNHLRYLKASLLDHVNTPNLMPIVFFYTPKLTSNFGTHDALDRLKGSLPDTLSVFYPLAGRVQDANYFDCNDEGVPYAQAEVANPLDDVVHKADISQLDKLLHSYDDQKGYTRLLLSIQVSTFTCGGLAIGVEMNHAIADALSVFMFVKTWASMAGGNLDHTNMSYPYFEISKVIPPLSPSKNNYLDPTIKVRPMAAKWFMFNEEKLHALRSKIMLSFNKLNENGQQKISLSMVLSSFIWSRFKVACHNSVNKDNIIPHEVSNAINIRPKLPPIDDNSYYFGNIYVTSIAKLSTEHNENVNCSSNYEDFVVKVKNSIRKITNDDGLIKSMQEGKEDLSYVMEYYERQMKEETFTLYFSDLRSLPVYEADFGWRKPVWVSSASLICKNFVALIPAGPSTKQIVAYIFLSRDDMTKLENDTEFTALLATPPL